MATIFQQKQKIELTGNPFVDTGLAVLATKSNCRNIEDLTLRKIKNVHGNGMELADINSRLKSISAIFTINARLTNPSFKNKRDEIKNEYAKVTTALLNNIGQETNENMCEICGNPSSVDLDKICKEPTNIGRDWFPLVGSLGSDAQALPSASRSLQVCATCLFAVQYLPQGVISVRGLLTLFQSTYTPFWYRLVRSIANDMTARTSKEGTVNTIGSGKGEVSGMVVSVNKAIDIMQQMKLEPGTSLTMWLFTNGGNTADCQIEDIPNFALEFLDKCRQQGLREEINILMTKNKYLLDSIINRHDYLPQYPSKRRENEGASHDFFMLYQTIICGYTISSLRTAYKIAQYILTHKIDPNNKKHKDFGVDIDKRDDRGQRSRVQGWIADMIADRVITFDEYYDLFVSDGNNNNRWSLLKYYLLKTDIITPTFTTEHRHTYSEHKKTVIEIGTRLYTSLMDRKGEDRFKREVLRNFEGKKTGEGWLRKQFEILTDETEGQFDYNDNWNKLVRNGNVTEALYLLRLLFTILFFHS